MQKTKFSSRMKIAFLNMMQAFGSAASQMARNAKLRVNEINLESRRHEILTEFSLQAFEMWHNGVKLPKELSDMFTELNEIDDKLSVLRAQKYAKVNEEEPEAGKAPNAAKADSSAIAEAAPALKETPAPALDEPAPIATPVPKVKPAAEPKPAAKPAPATESKTPAKPKKAPAVKKRIRATKSKPKE
ncbi:MAG TPA: hypothetical protein PK537_08985 [Candidatus Limiplasma sp.]|nr:hypothetical protein [Candidatus Limiplasma sp.]